MTTTNTPEPPQGTTVRTRQGTTHTRSELGWYPGPWNWAGLVEQGAEILDPPVGDDPRASRSGTVRRSPDGRIAVRREFAVTSDFMWIVIHGRDPENPGSTALRDDEVIGWEEIGGCPGTPAAEAAS